MRPITFILCLLLGGLAVAQGAANHAVTVSIPAVLRLGLEGSTTGQAQTVPLQVEVAAGSYRITPSSSTLTIFANSNWQLLVSYLGDELALSGQLEGRSVRLRSYPQVLSSGTPTGGWQKLTIRYGVLGLPADGSYGGVVIYTLARP